MRSSKKINVALWVLQGFLALFLGIASGAPKLFMPAAEIPGMPIPIDQTLLWIIGVAEVLGALGLILHGVAHIRTGLTPLAALGFVALTICAAIYQMMAKQPESAAFALVIGLLAGIVAYGRWKVAPHADSAKREAALLTA